VGLEQRRSSRQKSLAAATRGSSAKVSPSPAHRTPDSFAGSTMNQIKRNKMHLVLLLAMMVVIMVPAGFCVLVWCMNQPAPGINRHSYERIEEGMTMAEVEDILGGPPGDYRKHKSGIRYRAEGGIFGDEPRGMKSLEYWYSDSTDIRVGFADDGRVCWKQNREIPPREDSLVERLRRLLGL
jgi:hypothetical protein